MNSEKSKIGCFAATGLTLFGIIAIPFVIFTIVSDDDVPFRNSSQNSSNSISNPSLFSSFRAAHTNIDASRYRRLDQKVDVTHYGTFDASKYSDSDPMIRTAKIDQPFSIEENLISFNNTKWELDIGLPENRKYNQFDVNTNSVKLGRYYASTFPVFIVYDVHNKTELVQLLAQYDNMLDLFVSNHATFIVPTADDQAVNMTDCDYGICKYRSRFIKIPYSKPLGYEITVMDYTEGFDKITVGSGHRLIYAKNISNIPPLDDDQRVVCLYQMNFWQSVFDQSVIDGLGFYMASNVLSFHCR